MTFYLMTSNGVSRLDGNVTVTARIAVSQGNLVVSEQGKPVEPPIKTSVKDDHWYGRFPDA